MYPASSIWGFRYSTIESGPSAAAATRSEETEIATLVTIDVEQVPRRETRSRPSGVLTTSARGIEGQMQAYRALNLFGTASLIAF